MYSTSNIKALYNFSEKSIGFLIFFFSLLLFFPNLLCHAATPEQLDVIQKAAEAHVNNTVKVPLNGKLVTKAANLDARIKATDCPSPLKTSSKSTSNTTSNITVLVECSEDNWRIYVPVRTSVSMPLVTATHPLSRGEIVHNNDVALTMIELRAYRRQGFTSSSQVVGAKLKKNIRAGEVLERSDVCVVCRNEKVIIKAVKGELTITTKGTALSDGSTGDQVRVKNDKSNRIIDGVVTGIAEITVYF